MWNEGHVANPSVYAVIAFDMSILPALCQAILVIFRPQTGALSHTMTTE